jgi:ubiquinone/menaquinone biosynthesis C-methylase UbiE
VGQRRRKEHAPKLNIGCGYDKLKGYINVDKSAKVKPDLVLNVELGLPFPNNHFSEIYSEHALEHIRPYAWEYVLNEMGRVTKKGGKWTFILPFRNVWNDTNAFHYRTFSFTSFSQLCEPFGRSYYLDGFYLKDLTKYPNRLVRALISIFPFVTYFRRFGHEIKFKFEVVK